MHPADLAIALDPMARYLAFRKRRLEKVNSYRRVLGRGSACELVALNASPPIPGFGAFST
jgi:hypothetical protein